MANKDLAVFRINPALGIALAVFGMLGVSVSRAATITVTTTNMQTTHDSQCGLREAIQAVNGGASMAGCPAGNGIDDRIVVPSGNYRTPELMDILRSVTIVGAGKGLTTIETGGTYGFGAYSAPGGPVVLALEHLTVRKAPVAAPQAMGIFVKGGQLDTATLKLDHVRVGGYSGNGIRLESPVYNLHTETAYLYAADCSIDGNSQAGIKAEGAVFMIIDRCTLSKNSGSGMVLVDGPDALLRNSTVDENSTVGNGGGISALHGDDADSDEWSHVNLEHTTVSRNRAGGNGGGVYFQAVGFESHQSTISGNNADGSGGGMYDARHGGNSYTRHYNNTVAFNNAGVSGGGYYLSFTGTGTPDFQGTLVAKNTLSGSPAPSTAGTDLFTPFQITADACVFGTREGWREDCDVLPPGECGLQPSVRPGPGGILDPRIGPLTYLGGMTRVHPLLSGSPAIDISPAVLDAGCDPANLSTCSIEDLFDQRGFPRPKDGNGTASLRDWDAGSFELQCSAEAPPELVTNQGFETGTSGWTGSYGTTIATSTLQSHSGARSLLITNRNLGTWQGAAYDLLNLAQPGQSLAASAAVRVSGDPSEPVLLTRRAVCAGGAPTYQTVASGTATNSGWLHLSGTADVPGCALTELTIYVEGPRTGVNLHVDDVSIKRNGPVCENVATGTLPMAGTLRVTDEWSTSYCMELRVDNPNDIPTTDWLASFHLLNSTIYDIWNLSASGTSGSITVKPTADWSRVIAGKGMSHSLGFCVNRPEGDGNIPGAVVAPAIRASF